MLLTPQPIADRIGTVTPLGVRAPAFEAMSRMQRFQDPVLQVMGMAVALCAMSQAAGVPMRDLITTAERVLDDCEGPFTEHIQAIRMYAEHELLRRGQ